MNNLFLTFCFSLFLAFSSKANNIDLDNFYSVKSENNYSIVNRNEKIDYDFLLSRDINSIKEEQKISLFVVFDKQNKSIYKNTIYTIDYLTSLSNIPSSCILSIGFQDGMERFLLSKYKENGGGLDDFLPAVKSLIHDLLNEYDINISNVVLIGHSRTAYIATQFLFNYPIFVNAAIVGSSQDISTEKEIEVYADFLKTIEDKKLKRHYLFSAGKDNMGDGDQMFTDSLIAFFKNNPPNAFFFPKGEVFNCDHYNSLGISLNKNLLDLFSGYNISLQYSFDLLNSGGISDYNNMDFNEIYSSINDSLGMKFEMDISFYISMFYGFMNDYNGFYETNRMEIAQKVITEGIEKYGSDSRFIYHYVYYLLEKKQTEKAYSYFVNNLSNFNLYEWKSKSDLLDEIALISELFKEYTE